MSGGASGAAELARQLIEARTSRAPVSDPVQLPIPLALDVRDRCISALAATSPIVGYKVSLSTGAWGVLTEQMVFASGVTLPRASFFDPLLECELIFRAERDLSPDSGLSDVLDGCQVTPGIEIADSRWEGWKPSDGPKFVAPEAGLIAADNGMGGALVVGRDWAPARALPLPDVQISTRSAGRVLAQGSLAEVMGSPVDAIVWLVRQLAMAGRRITAGQLVSSGCPCHSLVTVPPSGGRWEAAVEGLGEAQVTFV